MKLARLIVCAAALLALSGCSGSSPVVKVTYHGSFQYKESDQTCYLNGYKPLQQGTQIRLLDGSGNLLAASKLGIGKRVRPGVCEWDVSMPGSNLPDVFQVSVGDWDPVAIDKRSVDTTNGVDVRLGPQA